MYIPTLISKFPYIRFKKTSIFEGKTIYEKRSVGNDGELLDWQKELITKNRNLLLDNQVPINKIRFVFQPSFEYDVDKNVINPIYDVMIPIDGETGKVKKEHPEISIGRPHNLICVPLFTHKVENNYDFIKHMVKNTKRGIVIFIIEEEHGELFSGYFEKHHFSVDTEYICLINLDDAVEYYKFDTL